MNETVSIIIPVYKVDEKYLRESIESVVDQTYNNLDIVLVDDGSTDHCGLICDEYARKDNRINVIHKENGGVSSARNIGILHAKGDWVAFLDPDDILFETAIDVMVSAVMKNRDLDMIIAGYQEIIDGKPGEVLRNGGGLITDHEKIQSLAKYMICKSYPSDDFGFTKKGIWGSCWGKLYKKELIRKNNALFEKRLHSQEDILFVTQMISLSKTILLIDIPIEYYRIHRESVSQSVDFRAVDNGICYIEALDKVIGNMNWNDSRLVLNSGCASALCDVMGRYYAHPDNKAPYCEKRARIRSLMENEYFKTAIKDENSYCSWKLRLMLFMLRYKLYLGLYMMGRIVLVSQRINGV